MRAVLQRVLACVGAASAGGLDSEPDSDLEALLKPVPLKPVPLKPARSWASPASAVLDRLRARSPAPKPAALDDVC